MILGSPGARATECGDAVLVELVEDLVRDAWQCASSMGPRLLVAQHRFERVEVRSTRMPSHLILDLVGIDREVIVVDRLKIPAIAGVADECVVAFGKAGEARSAASFLAS